MRFGRRILAALCVTGAAQAAAAAAPVADEALAQAEREGRARVIVRLAAAPVPGRASAAARQAGRAEIERAADAALGRVGGPVRAGLRRYRALPLLALELSPRELAELAEAPEVLAIDADRLLRPSLATSVPRVGAAVTGAAGLTGAGTAIVVLDTGVDSAHAFFGGRVVAEACFSAGNDCPNNQSTQFGPGAAAPCSYGAQCWHGTHVAGIAAGQAPTLQGVAPGADVIAIQTGSRETGAACGDAASPCVVLYDSDALASLDYVVDTLAASYTIAAVNMSFGSGTTWNSESACDASNASYKLAIDALRALGIASVAASGNDSLSTGIAAPACISSAIGVAATSKLSDAIASLSNTGEPLDLLAPGLGIQSSLPGGGYGNGSGTSMATSHVAGAFAVLRQADPAASVSELESALEVTGVPVSRSGLVRPRIQVDDAVRALGPAECFDGLDNDGDGGIDVDGDGGAPDPHCSSGFDDQEQYEAPPGCGIGPELALLLPLLGQLSSKRSARRVRNRRGV
jgi:subtilisin family serine protease